MITTLWTGLSSGALYGVVGALLTIPLVRCGVINFAVPFYVVLGNYLLLSMQDHGWTFVPELAVLLATGAALGAAQEFLTIRPALRQSSAFAYLLTTIGVGFAVEGFIVAHWGPTPATVSSFVGTTPLTILGGRMFPDELALIIVAAIAAIGFHIAVSHTQWGVIGRAVMADGTAASMRGVNVRRVRTSAFVVSSSLAVGFSLLAAPKTGVTTDSILRMVVFSFSGVAIGGFGSFAGSISGGFIVGTIEAIVSRYLGVDYVTVIIFSILAVMLMLRPAGLFGLSELRVV